MWDTKTCGANNGGFQRNLDAGTLGKRAKELDGDVTMGKLNMKMGMGMGLGMEVDEEIGDEESNGRNRNEAVVLTGGHSG